MEFVTPILLVLALAALVALLLRGRGDGSSKQISEAEDRLMRAIRETAQGSSDSQAKLGMNLTDELGKLRGETQTAIAERFGEAQSKISTSLTTSLAGLGDRVQKKLDEVRADNATQLDQMRKTVDEKLQTTLEKRLGESFQLVSNLLRQVHSDLGEVKSLAEGVGDLQRVLTNVRSRGILGEIQLGALLEQILDQSQYEKNVATVPGSGERVEFAVRLPGRGGSDTVWLPIDAKFPQEDHLRLLDAYEKSDAEAVALAQRGLRTRILAEAEKIRAKYLAPPHTTDFALMFLPTEGLYAEALRIDGLFESLQRDHHITIAGPTTLTAILNSLQMGFRTLAIEQRSSEVWKVLGAVRTEFGKFGGVLEGVRKKLQEASNKIDAASVRTRAMERTLKDVERLPENEVAALLPEADTGEDDETSAESETSRALDQF